MKAVIRSITCAALASSVALLSPVIFQASAQTRSAQGGLASVQPISASATACAAGLIEIAPVSFDTSGRPTSGLSFTG
jgi:hypothetical protein